MVPEELQQQINEIKALLADISTTIAEMQKRPCQLSSCQKNQPSRPVESVPHTYSIILDVARIDDKVCG